MKKKAQEYYRKKIENFSDKEDRIFKNPILKKEKIKKVHISGTCGKAMASVAGLFKDKGYELSGSDKACFPPMSIVLDNLSLKYKDFDEKNLKDIDLLVVGNVCSPDNPETAYARKNNIPQISGAEAVEEFFIEDKKSVVVAGTHGKTTTSSLLTTIFLEGEKNPAYLIGGVLQKSHTSYALGDEKTEYFIIEGDEYDTAYFDKAPKFLHYKPYISLITSVEYDHADIYENLDDYRQAFKFLILETKDDGKIFIWDEIENLNDLIEGSQKEILKYGFNKNSDIFIFNLKQEGENQIFDIKIFDKVYKKIVIGLSGKHNVLNSAVSFAIAILEKLDEEKIRKAVKDFGGVKKRQEVLADKNNILVIDDYAHHPTAVETTLDGLSKKYPNKNIIAIFEPRSNTSRMKVFQNKYVEVFKKASEVIISTPPFKSNDKKENFIDAEKLVEDLRAKKIKAENIESAEEIFKKLSSKMKANDMLVIMSNGDFGHLAQRLADFLNEK